MNVLARGLAVALGGVTLVLAADGKAACGDALGPGKRVASSPRFDVAFRTDPSPIAVSRHFALEVVVCAKSGVTATGLDVDAHMPAHRHGMNYRPSIAARPDGRYRVEGMLFHMPGDWEFRFDVRTARDSERAVLTLDIQ